MGSHSVTCHPAEVRIPPLPPAEAGTRFSNPGGMESWVDLCYVKVDQLGIEPVTCQSRVPTPYTTMQHKCLLVLRVFFLFVMCADDDCRPATTCQMRSWFVRTTRCSCRLCMTWGVLASTSHTTVVSTTRTSWFTMMTTCEVWHSVHLLVCCSDAGCVWPLRSRPVENINTSDVKTEFFSQPIIDLLKPVFTDDWNVIIIWNYRWTLHRPGLCKVPCWRYLMNYITYFS